MDFLSDVDDKKRAATSETAHTSQCCAQTDRVIMEGKGTVEMDDNVEKGQDSLKEA